LDTHALLWWLDDPARLSDSARAAVASENALVFVSAASAWEISIKQASGKLRCPDDLEDALSLNAFQTLPVTVRHGLLAGRLPPHHADPFDRMLVAQASSEGLTLVTRDVRLQAYGIAVVAA
jgi:PIN domain nuclease of toxin-antitoxin system